MLRGHEFEQNRLKRAPGEFRKGFLFAREALSQARRYDYYIPHADPHLLDQLDWRQVFMDYMKNPYGVRIGEIHQFLLSRDMDANKRLETVRGEVFAHRHNSFTLARLPLATKSRIALENSQVFGIGLDYLLDAALEINPNLFPKDNPPRNQRYFTGAIVRGKPRALFEGNFAFPSYEILNDHLAEGECVYFVANDGLVMQATILPRLKELPRLIMLSQADHANFDDACEKAGRERKYIHILTKQGHLNIVRGVIRQRVRRNERESYMIVEQDQDGYVRRVDGIVPPFQLRMLPTPKKGIIPIVIETRSGNIDTELKDRDEGGELYYYAVDITRSGNSLDTNGQVKILQFVEAPPVVVSFHKKMPKTLK